MAKIIQLDQYRNEQIAKKCFRFWNRHIEEPCSYSTRWADLKDETLLQLAAPGEESTLIFYMLIQDIVQTTLPQSEEQADLISEMEKMDLHLYLADKVRLEMMLRLSWLQSYPQQELSIIELVKQYHHHRLENYNNPPELSADHPGHQQYQQLINREKELFIRKLFPEALNHFNSKLKQ